jgi:hypothetical protein
MLYNENEFSIEAFKRLSDNNNLYKNIQRYERKHSTHIKTHTLNTNAAALLQMKEAKIYSSIPMKIIMKI